MDLYTLTLALDSNASATLRGWLTSILSENSVSRGSSRESHEIVLAAAEALNNAVRNSAPQGTTVVVTMSIVGRDVYLTVTERDKSLARHESEPFDTDSDPELASSLGLTLMQGLMDQVDLYDSDDGTTVRLVKRLRLPARLSGSESGRAHKSPLADASRAL